MNEDTKYLWAMNNYLAHDVLRLKAEVRSLKGENAKLRDLIFDILVDEERGNTEEGTYYEHVRLAKELGIEVES